MDQLVVLHKLSEAQKMKKTLKEFSRYNKPTTQRGDMLLYNHQIELVFSLTKGNELLSCDYLGNRISEVALPEYCYGPCVCTSFRKRVKRVQKR